MLEKVDMKKLSYAHYSKIDDPQKLPIDCTIIYCSESNIFKMTYSGVIPVVDRAKNISQHYKEELKKLNCLASVGGQSKSIHLYAPDTVNLDGYKRICYINQKMDALRITEYYGRSSRYSAFFRLLQSRMRQLNKFQIDNGAFIVDLSNINLFVDLVNEIMASYLTGKYHLFKYKPSQFEWYDKVTLEEKVHFYHKVYWLPADFENELSSIGNSPKRLFTCRLPEDSLKKMNDFLNRCNSNVEDGLGISQADLIDGLLKYFFQQKEITLNGMKIEVSKLMTEIKGNN
ncbi:MAG: hypothetical protein ABFC94_00200 [Syntrophomonas sp.]